jgi:hypothetical protein
MIAEGLRAFVEVNDPTSHWRRATRARLRNVDPMLYQYVERLFQHVFMMAAQPRSLYLTRTAGT